MCTHFPKSSLLVVLVALALAGWAGANWWAASQMRAAALALHEDRLGDAQEHIRSCLSVFPGNPRFHFLAARIARLDSRYKEAQNHLDECQRLEGISDALQLECILLRVQGGEATDLEENAWNCIRQNHPESAWILEALARGYFQDMRLLAARYALEQWIKQEPKSIRALRWRGLAYEHLQDADSAIATYLELLDLAPHHWIGRLRLVEVLVEMRRTEDAAKHLEVLRQTRADDPSVQLFWARCLVLQGKIDEARKQFETLLAADPKNPRALYHRGLLEMQAGGGGPEMAETWFRQSLKADPGFFSAQYSLYLCLQQQPDKRAQIARELKNLHLFKQDTEQLKAVTEKLDRLPNNPDLFAQLGEIFLRRGRDERGMEFLDRVLQIDPYHAKAHQLLADEYQKKGQVDLAARHRKLAERNAK